MQVHQSQPKCIVHPIVLEYPPQPAGGNKRRNGSTLKAAPRSPRLLKLYVASKVKRLISPPRRSLLRPFLHRIPDRRWDTSSRPHSREHRLRAHRECSSTSPSVHL